MAAGAINERPSGRRKRVQGFRADKSETARLRPGGGASRGCRSRGGGVGPASCPASSPGAARSQPRNDPAECLDAGEFPPRSTPASITDRSHIDPGWTHTDRRYTPRIHRVFTRIHPGSTPVPPRPRIGPGSALERPKIEPDQPQIDPIGTPDEPPTRTQAPHRYNHARARQRGPWTAPPPCPRPHRRPGAAAMSSLASRARGAGHPASSATRRRPWAAV